MLVYATAYGSIIGWDLRQALPKSNSNGSNKGTPAFKLENDLRDGILTSMAIYPDKVCFLDNAPHINKPFAVLLKKPFRPVGLHLLYK